MQNFKIELKWAIIFTIVALLWMLLEKIVGLHDQYIDFHPYLTNLFAIPAIAVIVMALKDKKRNFYLDDMNYLQGFKSGVILSIFIALLSPFSQWITSNIITPEYFPNVIKRSVELGYYKNTEDASAYFNFQNYAILGAFAVFFMGISITTIAMIFIKSKKKLEMKSEI